MKLFVVDNNPRSTVGLQEAIAKKRWSYHAFYPEKAIVAGEETVTNKSNLQRFLREFYDLRPDVVVLDAALTEKEEEFLDGLRLSIKGELTADERTLLADLNKKRRLTTEEMRRLDTLSAEGKENTISEETLSGFIYCRALARELPGVPIVFLTKYPYGPVARIAMRAGADRVLSKQDNNDQLIREIEELVKSKIPHDSAFYWPMREKLDESRDMWQGDALRKALDRFYLNASTVRRFGLFTASLRDILSPLFQGDAGAEKILMLSLVKSQVLLSLVDPRLRDHVKHTGNVFWMGYRLLHEIVEFREPQLLHGCNQALYGSPSSLRPFEQLSYSWTLASLFHDYGYVDERQDQLVGLVSSLVQGANISYTNIRGDSWVRNIKLLRDFVKKIGGNDHFLYHFIDTVMASYSSEMDRLDKKGEKTPLIDHGFLSAHRLLDMVPYDRLNDQTKNIVLHAALAIACHNHVEMLRKWKFEAACDGVLKLGLFPVCSLLIFCDSVQTWDREVNLDTALTHAEEQDGLLERLVLSDTAYVSGSEICEFSTCPRSSSSGYDISIRLRYFVEPAGGVTKVCEELGSKITDWIGLGILGKVCKMTGLSSLLHGKIVYELPMLAGERTITF